MNFFADEGLDFPLVDALRQKGFLVIYAAEDFPAADDETISKEAVNRKAILLTKDKDFGEIVIRRQQASNGLVLIRIEALNQLKNIDIIVRFLAQHAHELADSFTVIQEDKIRIRKL